MVAEFSLTDFKKGPNKKIDNKPTIKHNDIIWKQKTFQYAIALRV